MSPRLVHEGVEARRAIRALIVAEQHGRCAECPDAIHFVRDRDGVLSGLCTACLRRLSKRVRRVGAKPTRPRPRHDFPSFDYDVEACWWDPARHAPAPREHRGNVYRLPTLRERATAARASSPKPERLSLEARALVLAEAKGRCGCGRRATRVRDGVALEALCLPCFVAREADDTARRERLAAIVERVRGFASRFAEPQKTKNRPGDFPGRPCSSVTPWR